MTMLALRVDALSDRVRARGSVVGRWGDLWWPKEQSVHPWKCSRCVVPPGSQALPSALCPLCSNEQLEGSAGPHWSDVDTKNLELPSALSLTHEQ